MGSQINPTCDSDKPCFARGNGRCSILKEVPFRTPCPFQKPSRDWTKFKHYPYNPASSAEVEHASPKLKGMTWKEYKEMFAMKGGK